MSILNLDELPVERKDLFVPPVGDVINGKCNLKFRFYIIIPKFPI